MKAVLAFFLAASMSASALAAPAATTDVFKIDPKASVIQWMGKKKITNDQHKGTVPVKSGEVQVEANKVKGGLISFDMKKLENEDLKSDPGKQKKLLGHLKSDDFFSVDKHPEVTFKVTEVKAIDLAKGNMPNHEISGDLTIKGITHKVTFPAIVRVLDKSAEATGKLVIDRSKWDVKYGSGKFFENLGDKIIADDIEFDIKLVGNKK